MSREYKSVHDAHCCKRHSHCKYGDYDCPVVNGLEEGIRGECCEWEDNDPSYQTIKKLTTALHDAYAALRRGRPQIQGALVQQDFDLAIESAREALEAVQGKWHETNTDNPIDFPTTKKE